MNKNIKKVVSISLLGIMLALPLLASALAQPGEPNAVNTDVPGIVTKIVTPIWQAFVGLAVIMMIIAGVLFLSAGGSPDKISQARMALLWGIVGIAVAVIAFSLPAILKVAIGA